MIGTLWASESGVCVCVKYENEFYTLVYLSDTQCKSHVHKSSINFYYKQLTQPQEGT